MKRIALITSGGDAPGMNAAIRGVVRTAIGRGMEVLGYQHGYSGILLDEFQSMDSKSVGGIINRGGTVLQTARCKEFREKEGRERAVAQLRKNRVEGLVVIGGDGSLTGALVLHEEFGFPVYGIPGSIDNDLNGTDYSIGFDTAVGIAVDAIDRIRDTAYSHDRVFVIEVMGRRNGFIAVEAGLAGGAEAILIPEVPYSLPGICDKLRGAGARGKRSSIIIVAEGAGSAAEISPKVAELTGFDTRYVVLGHIQRGGSPTAFDRVLGLRLGAFAVERLIAGYTAEMAGIVGGRLVGTPLSQILNTPRRVDPEKLLLAEVMAQ